MRCVYDSLNELAIVITILQYLPYLFIPFCKKKRLYPKQDVSLQCEGISAVIFWSHFYMIMTFYHKITRLSCELGPLGHLH